MHKNNTLIQPNGSKAAAKVRDMTWPVTK